MHDVNELYHRRIPFRSKDNHKYTRKIWKNGHWVYYYDDGSSTLDYPKGQNYKLKSTVDTPKQTSNKALVKKTVVNTQSNSTKIDSLINKGKDALRKLDHVMSIPVLDLLKMKPKKNQTDEYSIGQNYKTHTK